VSTSYGRIQRERLERATERVKMSTPKEQLDKMSSGGESTPKEQLDSQGNTLKVADLTFIEGVLGKGSYGTVRLAVRKRPDAHDDDSWHNGSRTVTPPPTSQQQHHQHHKEIDQQQPNRRLDTGFCMERSSSAPSGDDFFKISESEKSIYGKKSTKTVASTHTNTASPGYRNQQKIKMHRSVSARGSFDEEDTDEQLVAVKIYNKSILKRIRTMERNKETKKVQVKTALEQVEREIALMKKLSHPNLVGFFDAMDSPDSDLLYMVIEYMPLGGRYCFSLLFSVTPKIIKIMVSHPRLSIVLLFACNQ
jgi:serine/threonine protein kinase